MDFDFSIFNDGVDISTLQKPMQPVQMEAIMKLYPHLGEDMGQYSSFLEVVNDLAQALKFSPTDSDGTWLNALKKGYTNLNLDPSADQWDLIYGMDSNADDSSIVDEMKYFDWNSIKGIGAGQSYYELANGDISGYTPEQAFYLMCSMVEARARVCR